MTRKRGFFSVFLFVSAGCTSITPHLGFDQVQREVGNRGNLKVTWDTGSDEDREARPAGALLMNDELSAYKAIQKALLNHRELQAVYEELRIAQADLVQAGLLKNPVFNGDLRFS